MKPTNLSSLFQFFTFQKGIEDLNDLFSDEESQEHFPQFFYFNRSGTGVAPTPAPSLSAISGGT